MYIGIDVSKTELVVAVRLSSESFTLAYHRAGLKQLVGLAALAGLWLLGRIVCLVSADLPTWLAVLAYLVIPTAVYPRGRVDRHVRSLNSHRNECEPE